MKNQKNERGITLVALVVTIVVLLILAGITIMYVLSDNGIFGKAQTAKSETNRAVVEEIVMSAIWEAQADYYDPTTTREVTNADSAEIYIKKSIEAKGLTVHDDFAVTAFNDADEGTKLSGHITYGTGDYVVNVNTKATAGQKLITVDPS